MSTREVPSWDGGTPLRIEVVDEDGSPAPARVYAATSDGSTVPLHGGLAYAMDRPFGREAHVVADGPLTCSPASGSVVVRAERGPEFLADEVEVTLGADQPGRRVELGPRRWIDMNDRGWFSGDLHGHRDPGDMPLLLAAEALNVGSVIASHNGAVPASGSAATPADASIDWSRAVAEKAAYSVLDVELERLEGGPGAIVGIGVRRAMPFTCGAWEPTDVDVAERIRELDGHVDLEKPFWPLGPALVALGCVDSVGLANNHFGRTWTYTDIAPIGAIEPAGGIADRRAFISWLEELYHRFLNCGFRLPVSGGSASGWMPNPPGLGRTYVRLPSGRFDHRSWLQGLRDGRSFATTGPMIDLTVDGQRPGDVVPHGATHPLRVVAGARSAEALERLQIVRDGEVVAEASGSEQTRTLRIETELPRTSGGWIGARCLERSRVAPGFAHTSPVYLAGRASPRRCTDAAFMLRWLDGVADRLRADVAGDATAARSFSVLDRGRDVYRSIAS